MHSKRLLSGISLSLLASAAHAGPWVVGQQTPTYSNSHPLGSPNSAPYYSSEPADITSNFTEGAWTHDTGETPGPGGQYDGPGVGNEAKFRADCNVAGHNHDDPIIAPGVPNGSSHDHTTFGNTAYANSMYNADYSGLRSTGNSTCFGGPLNRTLYWEPSLKKQLTNGAEVTIKPANIVTYYESGDLSAIGTGAINDPNVVARWPRAINFIEGFNMADPTGTRYATIIAAANVGNPGRYTLSQPGGFVGWQCNGSNGSNANSPVPGSSYQPYLRNANGTATLTCAPGTQLIAELASDPCWDGKNPTSPDGRLHMMPFLRDNNTGKNVCPDNWYRVQVFRAKVTFNNFIGSSEYKEWYFSSDRMTGMTQFLNGQSAHFDLIPAWSYGTAASPGTFLIFGTQCGGQTIVMAGVTLSPSAHECGSGRISSGSQLWNTEASPDGSQPSPLVVLSPDQSNYLRFFAGSTGNPIPGSIHNCHIVVSTGVC
jgi:hypothetical protein